VKTGIAADRADILTDEFLTAVLMEYKNKAYPDYDVTDEFTLE